MGVYLYCTRKSTGALELATALGGTRIRRFDGANFWVKGKRVVMDPKSTIICWGAYLPEMDDMRVLNSQWKYRNKYAEFQQIKGSRVPIVEMMLPEGRSKRQFEGAGYIGRAYHHAGGMDLLKPVVNPDYYSYKMNFVNEYRMHSFGGKSIRAGMKVPREGFVPTAKWRMGYLHPWVRSYDGGWRVNYDGFESTPEMRLIAANAVKALGLTFGAVDIGQTQDGELFVLEVNRAPGIEGHSIEAYTRAITRWMKKVPKVVPEVVEEEDGA